MFPFLGGFGFLAKVVGGQTGWDFRFWVLGVFPLVCLAGFGYTQFTFVYDRPPLSLGEAIAREGECMGVNLGGGWGLGEAVAWWWCV